MGINLLESAHLFQILYNASPDAILLIDPSDPDISWPILDCNEATCKMNGYTRDELIGNSIDMLNTTVGTPADHLAYLNDLRQSGVLHREACHRHKDGYVINVEISTSILNFGGRELVLGIDRDITKIKQTQEALKKSEALFRSYFDLSTAGIAINTPTKGWLDCNNRLCSMLGYTREELFKTEWPELTHPDDLRMDLDYLNHMLQGEIDHYSIDKRLIRKNGSSFWINLSIRCVRRPDGSVDYLIGSLVDISERKQAEEEIRKLNEELELRIEEKTTELKERIVELERFHDATINRELRMKELRDEIKRLKRNT
jgi:PAS domain S-box-containing protein